MPAPQDPTSIENIVVVDEFSKDLLEIYKQQEDGSLPQQEFQNNSV